MFMLCSFLGAWQVTKKADHWGGHSGRAKGVLLVAVSAVFFSTAGLFSKGIAADAWSIIFWRGVFAVAGAVVWLLVTGRIRDEASRFGGPSLALAVIYAAGTAAFIPAFKLTSVANVALIWSAAPILAGALGWWIFGQRMTFGFMLACASVLAGTAIIVRGSFGGSGLSGDLLALWMTLMMVLIMIIYRRWPGTPVTLPTVAASLLLLPFGWGLGDPASASTGQIAMMALFGLTFVVASVTLAAGSTWLAPGETALVSVSETPWAILLAGLVLAEWPSPQTVLGGTIILVAVLWYQLTALRRGA